MPKIRIDKDKCIGCGLCESICGKTFEMDKEKAKVKRENIDRITCEKEAANSCPTEAITITENINN